LVSATAFWGRFGIVVGSFCDSFEIELRSCWGRFGIVLESFWDRFWIVLVSFWDRFWIVLGYFWDLVGVVLKSFWDRFGIVLGSFWECFRIILGSFWGRPSQISWERLPLPLSLLSDMLTSERSAIQRCSSLKLLRSSAQCMEFVRYKSKHDPTITLEPHQKAKKMQLDKYTHHGPITVQ